MIDVEVLTKQMIQKDKNIFPGLMSVGAIVKLCNSVWFAHNSYRTHPQMKRSFANGNDSYCCHAELNALAKVPRQSRNKVQLYVFRVLRNGTLTMGKPCTICQKYLFYQGVKQNNIYYTDWNGDWQRMS